MSSKTPINLVLGSGGARGLAHIGVIRVLEEAGYEIHSITACSMGALVGALYVTGHLAAYEDWVTSLTRWDVLRFLNLSRIGRSGMVNGDKLMEKLGEWLSGVDIKSLPIPITVVAADLIARKEVWISSGDLLDAVRASIAVPGVFTPLVKHGRVLVDGGILNPIPIPPTRLDSALVTVAVSLSGREVLHPFGHPDSANAVKPHADTDASESTADHGRVDSFLGNLQRFFGRDSDLVSEQEMPSEEQPALSAPALTDVMLGMFLTMQDTLARHQLASNPPDLLIDIPCNICQSHEFYKARDLIPAGAYWARRAIEDEISGLRART